jgi:DNA-directed RNA polymerase subunit M/transcription elongation factor TFIIS
MNDLDPNYEWRQLSETYAAMTDGELQAVADEAYELTDIARQALQAEISRRGLPFELRQEAQTDEDPAPAREGHAISPAEMDLVELRRVWDMDEAADIKQRLDAGSVPSYLGPDLVDDVHLLHASFEHGVAIKVRDFDEQRAMGVLANSYRPPQADAVTDAPVADESDEEEYAAHCPKCHSTEIVFQSLELDPATKSAFDSKFKWSCDACGYQWKDDGVESES